MAFKAITNMAVLVINYNTSSARLYKLPGIFPRVGMSRHRLSGNHVGGREQRMIATLCSCVAVSLGLSPIHRGLDVRAELIRGKDVARM